MDITTTAAFKWFCLSKDYGFVTMKDGSDVFLHGNQLRQSGLIEGIESVQSGAEVHFDLSEDKTGRRCCAKLHSITNVKKPAKKVRGVSSKRSQAQKLPAPRLSDRLVGKVISFDHDRGFGFIAVDGFQNVFVHITDVSDAMEDGFIVGAVVMFAVGEGRKGPVAIPLSFQEELLAAE